MADVISSVPEFVSLAERGFKFGKWASDKLGGVVLFLSPQQRISAFKSADKTLSQWEIAVRMKAPSWRNVVLPECTIECAYADFHEKTWSPTLHLRWFAKDSDRGVVAQSLVQDRTYLIPMMQRRENDGPGILLTERFYERSAAGNEVLRPERYLIRIAVRSGRRIWVSGRYFASVPPPGMSNGLFYLERRYDDQLPAQPWIRS